MSADTLFITPLQSAWRGDVDDPTDGEVVGQFLGQEQQNILYERIESMSLGVSDTRSITFAGVTLKNEWVYLVAKVIGTARINVSADDTDGSTVITSKWQGYGTEVFPGFIIISSYNVNTISVEGLAAGTTVELFAAIACADNDTRLIT